MSLPRHRTTVAALVAAACSLALLAAVPASGTARGPSDVGTRDGAAAARPVAGCSVFPKNNYWNADISALPQNARSDAWLRHMSPRSKLHPDFGRAFGAQPVPYGIPITIVGGGHRRVNVGFTYARESDKVRYPFGSDTKIEGGRSSEGDRHAIVVDKTHCRLYETWNTRKRDGRWHAGSGAV